MMKLSSDNGSITVRRLRRDGGLHSGSLAYLSRRIYSTGRYNARRTIHVLHTTRTRILPEETRRHTVRERDGIDTSAGREYNDEVEERKRWKWRGERVRSTRSVRQSDEDTNTLLTVYLPRRLFMLADGHLCCTHIALRCPVREPESRQSRARAGPESVPRRAPREIAGASFRPLMPLARRYLACGLGVVG